MRSLTGVYVIWLRDIKRFWRDKPRIVGSIAQPALFLFILGTGMGSGLSKAFAHGQAFAPGVKDYVTFIYPGIIGMTILFTSIFSAISIVWDREFGFLKEILVAPIPRWSVALGKACGGSTVAMIQGAIMLIFAPIIGVKLTLAMVIQLFFLMLLISFALTSLGIVIAARIKTMEGFQVIMNFLVMPLFFLSGAMFPLRGLPEWLDWLVKIDPLSYGVDALRYTVLGVPQLQVHSMTTNLAVLATFALVMVAIGVFSFRRQE